MTLDLPGRTVHLWHCHLKAGTETLDRCRDLLSSNEWERAAAYASQELNQRYTMRRAGLRLLLGSYLGVKPAGVSFVDGPGGKLQMAESASDLHWNVSESGGLAAYAFTWKCELGVDVEQERILDDIPALIQQFFHPAEGRDLLALPAEKIVAAFFACWTRKEAYIKAVGGGLAIPLVDFRVSVDPDGPAALLEAWRGDDVRGWNLHSFHPSPGFSGALAYRDAPREVVVRSFSLEELMSIPDAFSRRR